VLNEIGGTRFDSDEERLRLSKPGYSTLTATESAVLMPAVDGRPHGKMTVDPCGATDLLRLLCLVFADTPAGRIWPHLETTTIGRTSALGNPAA
jgi:hypothetical protein